MKIIELSINGKPMPKQSVKQGKSFDGSKVFYKDSKIVKREKEILQIVKNQIGENHQVWFGKPIFITITYIYKYPSNMSKRMINESNAGQTIYKVTSPDVGDNLNKLLLDVLEKTIYSLDSEIVNVNSTKVYGNSDKTVITLIQKDEDCLFFPFKKQQKNLN